MTSETPRGSSRRAVLLDAGVAVLAASGMRGLTHRAVDRAAGLPEGTCSAYLRTRSALVTALAEHVAARLTDDVEQVAHRLATAPGDHEAAAREVGALFGGWLHGRDLLARFELGLESVRDPTLRELFAPWRARLVGLVAGAQVPGDTDDPDEGPSDAEALVAALDGVLLGALMVSGDDERAAFLSRALPRLLSGLGGVSRG